MKKSLETIDGPHLEGLRALVRVDFNVPLTEHEVQDRTRIRAALPTINWLRNRGTRVILLSHLGRPGGEKKPELSLQPVRRALESELGVPVTFLGDPTTDDAVRRTKQLKRGDVALAENTRFFPGEVKNDPELARRFAALGDFFVDDAFGTAHRAHASTEGVARLLKPAVAGFLIQKELQYLGETLHDPKRPFVAVLGGAKISGKIDVIRSLLPKADNVLVGGAMACTFFLAKGFNVGESLVEPEKVDLARALIAQAGSRLQLPEGAVIARKLEAGAEVQSVPADRIPDGWAVFDIDEATRETFATAVRDAGTVLWNGPMGVFECPPFDQGTIRMAYALAEATQNGATTIVGGGDSAAAIARVGLERAVTHVSTGGGASLEFLQGKELPGVAALDDA